MDFVNGAPAYDDWGHGTHVAGIVAGNGYDSYGETRGIAPGANIIALKALDGNGLGTISNIIAAIDYAISVKTTYNIRVMNMSLGAGVFESYRTDPLTLAPSARWTPASSSSPRPATSARPPMARRSTAESRAPGNAPWVLTVGASSTHGHADRDDDTIAGYSSRGPTMLDFRRSPTWSRPAPARCR